MGVFILQVYRGRGHMFGLNRVPRLSGPCQMARRLVSSLEACRLWW
jgi:hypothetical protein